MLKRIDHIGVVVPDLEKARKFYEEKYGVTPGPVIEVSPVLKVSFEQFENCKVELLQPTDINADSMQANWLREHPEGGLHHMAFETDNIEKTISDLDAKDCKAQMAIRPSPKLNEKICFLKQEDSLNVLTEMVNYV